MLECGCGSAEVSAALAAHGYDCTLLDASPAALHVARRRFERRGLAATYTLGNVYQLPFPGRHFRHPDQLRPAGTLRRCREGHRGDGARHPAGGDVLRRYRAGALLGADGRDGLQRRACASPITACQGDPRRGLHEAGQPFPPDFYENDYPLERYRQFMRDAGLRGIVIRGNRPVPVLTLRRGRAPLCRGPEARRRLWRRFDEAGTPLTNWWGAGWWAWRVKLPPARQ